MTMLKPRNPVLWIALALPLVTVLASFATLGAALVHPDNELPEQYHWEGFRLDRDFERAQRAAALGVRASFEGLGTEGRCVVTLELQGAAPRSLSLRLTHGTRPSLDQNLVFENISVNAGRAVFAGDCRKTPDAHWRAELSDAENGWSIRQNLRGSLADAVLSAGAVR
jgi:hypothetical protein